MATRCSRMLSSVSSGSQLPLSLNAFSPARTSRQTMLRFAPDILVTAASNTLEAARQMSGPVPSPSMNGMMGWSGTIQWPSRKSILAPTAPPRRPSTWVGMAPILPQKGQPLQASLFAAIRPTSCQPMGQPALNRSRAAWPRELRSVSAGGSRMERERGDRGVNPLTRGDDLRLRDDPEREQVIMGTGLMRLTRYTRSSLVRTLILLVISGCGGPGSGLIGIATTGGGGGTAGGSAAVP